MYNFKKIKNKEKKFSFYNQYFQREKREELNKIKRRPVKVYPVPEEIVENSKQLGREEILNQGISLVNKKNSLFEKMGNLEGLINSNKESFQESLLVMIKEIDQSLYIHLKGRESALISKDKNPLEFLDNIIEIIKEKNEEEKDENLDFLKNTFINITKKLREKEELGCKEETGSVIGFESGENRSIRIDFPGMASNVYSPKLNFGVRNDSESFKFGSVMDSYDFKFGSIMDSFDFNRDLEEFQSPLRKFERN